MEKKLKKRCKISKTKVGERYCLVDRIDYDYVFIVKENNKKKIKITYLDGTEGLYFNSDPLYVYEFPLTPVERELI
jgi:hypothetical protein